MQQTINKSNLINGILFIGGLLSLKFLLGALKIGILSFIAFSISILIIYLLYRFATQYRDNECNKEISYGKAFGFLFSLYFWGSVITSVIILLYTGLINPDFLAGFTNEVLTAYDKLGVKVDDTVITLLEALYQPIPFALLNVFSGALSAAFWGLILAAFVKKEKTIFE